MRNCGAHRQTGFYIASSLVISSRISFSDIRFGWDDDDDFETRLDAIDPHIFFLDSFRSFAISNGKTYEALMQKMPANTQEVLQAHIQRGEMLKIRQFGDTI